MATCPSYLLLFVTLLGATQLTVASTVVPNHDLERILGKLAGTTSTDQYRELDSAVKSSPHLIDQLNRLASSGKLTEIVVLAPSAAANAPKPGPFSAWMAGTSMVFTETLLSQLTKNREYDVVHPDDILPNNTTFVLAHLAFHLDIGTVKPRDFPVMNDYVVAMLDQEARAYIQAWNDTLDAAVQQNHHKQLTPGQVGNLMFNMRYRFAFVTALNQPTDKIQFEENGVIEENDSNAHAIATALKSSSVADIQ